MKGFRVVGWGVRVIALTLHLALLLSLPLALTLHLALLLSLLLALTLHLALLLSLPLALTAARLQRNQGVDCAISLSLSDKSPPEGGGRRNSV